MLIFNEACVRLGSFLVERNNGERSRREVEHQAAASGVLARRDGLGRHDLRLLESIDAVEARGRQGFARAAVAVPALSCSVSGSVGARW